jgi:uncharacterized membrane protein YbhN (UPF0104 family)
VRTLIILGTNFVVGTAALVYVLDRFGAPALALLTTRPHGVLLAVFPLVVAAAFVCYALRWRILLDGLGAARRLGPLTAYRAAGQSLSSLIPSGKLGGEPVRALLLTRAGVPGPPAIASVAVDRTLEMATAAPFACFYAAVLLQRGVPELEGAFVTVALGAAGLAVGILLMVRRLRRGAGLVTAVARSTGLDRLRLVQGQMVALAEAEAAAARLIAQPRRIARGVGAGAVANLLVMVEYYVLLSAFGLPATPLAVVAAIFASGAAHSIPVPAAVGALEGAQLWMFTILGHPPEVGLAIGLAVRLREVMWVLPGLVYLVGHGLAAPLARLRVETPGAGVERLPG